MRRCCGSPRALLRSFALPVALAEFLFIRGYIRERTARQAFDRASWELPAGGEQVLCRSREMARELRWRELRAGMSRAAVEALLGPPDEIAQVREYSYDVGMCHGFGFDYDSLEIYFDAQGSVRRSQVHGG